MLGINKPKTNELDKELEKTNAASEQAAQMNIGKTATQKMKLIFSTTHATPTHMKARRGYMLGGTQMSTGVYLGIFALFIVAMLGTAYVVKGTGSSAPAPLPGHSNLSFTGGVCTTGALTKLALTTGYANQQQNNVSTAAAMAYNVLSIPTTGFTDGSGATLSTGSPAFSNTSIQCGGNYTLVFSTGQSTSYYPFAVNTGQIKLNTTKYSTSQIQKVAQLSSVQFSNQTGGTGTLYTALPTTNVVTAGKLVVAGQTYNFYMYLNTGSASYGGNSTLVGLGANTTGIQSVAIYAPNGQSLNQITGVPVPSTYNSPAGFGTTWFRAPDLVTWNNPYGPYLIKVTTSSAFTANTDISVAINDNPGEIVNGQFIYPEGGLDPNTRADLGEPLLMYGPSTEAFNAVQASGPILLRAH